ncbi:MmcB family DNA repair protein [Clostridium perfringens]|uniref:MmcB family DNA repair protein n=1 Tax=Clostridium perfringens TaxID=1502 RepID=UPI0039ECA881|nr:MmcB family DNA repair protein [Clostridium perfringens]EHR1332446.1 MmcB family DNA repair protein [Clostridium perfringens]EHR1426026.1 MmcB family DNA repair protein [Clostridium perfringens]
MRDKIIELIEKGIPLKEISDILGANYNTVRQTSVSLNLYKKISKGLSAQQKKNLKSIGNNIRTLSSIKENKEAINTISDYINEKTTRKDLENLVESINEIQSKKEKLEKAYDDMIKDRRKDIIKIKNRMKKIKDIDKITEKLDSQFIFVRKIEKQDIKKGYLNLIGLSIDLNEERLYYTLAKTVNLNLWNKLRKAEAIYPYNNEIIDMEKFIKLTVNTIKRNDYYKNGSVRKNVIEIKHLTAEKQIQPYLNGELDEIMKLNSEIEKIKDDFKNLSKTSINNYFKQREMTNHIIEKDILTHTKIQEGGAKWLFNNDCISTIELKKDNYQFDVIGYNKEKEIIILEAKASLSDLRADKKIENYMNYCDKLYLISNKENVCECGINFLDERIGVIRLNKSYGFYKILREAKNLNNGTENLIFDINKKNCKHLLFGTK